MTEHENTMTRIREQAREYARRGATWPGDPALDAVTQNILDDLGLGQHVDAGELSFDDARRAVAGAVAEQAG